MKIKLQVKTKPTNNSKPQKQANINDVVPSIVHNSELIDTYVST